MAQRSFFTTFEISEICEVNPTTVQNWVKEKKLKAYVTPGGHRRVLREDLISFMKEFGMPIPAKLIANRPLVLIVDDEDPVREMLVTMIQTGEEDLEVVGVATGVEALLFIGERKPDLLILDILMPGMNGIDVCQKLKANPATQGIKIVAISGKHDEAVRAQIMRAGADLFFNKPLDIVKFREEALKLMYSGSSR
jgi:excisionase family DNA binding protein